MSLWHPAFWRLAFANLFLCMSVYMQIPSLPLSMRGNYTLWQTGVTMGFFGLGLFCMGAVCNYLVQRYRRHHVCQLSIFFMMVVLGVMYYMAAFVPQSLTPWWLMSLLRFLLGASFGLSQMILSSTLVIDTCESFQRTEANHSAAWFGRFAISLGPVVALLVHQQLSYPFVVLASGLCCLMSLLLIQSVDFPFKAPDDGYSVFSFDRFLLTDGWLLFFNLLLVSTAVGLLFSLQLSLMFYAMLMAGFLLALLAGKYIFADADLKSEAISALLLMAAALFILGHRHGIISEAIPPVFVGFGVGVVGSRFLLFFIKLSRHCQRGTSQSTFFLAWEAGVAFGLFLGYAVVPDHICIAGEMLCVLSLALYNFVTHPWYMKHKNR